MLLLLFLPCTFTVVLILYCYCCFCIVLAYALCEGFTIWTKKTLKFVMLFLTIQCDYNWTVGYRNEAALCKHAAIFFSGMLFWSLKEFSRDCLYKNFLKLKRVQCWYHEISFPFFFPFFCVFLYCQSNMCKRGCFLMIFSTHLVRVIYYTNSFEVGQGFLKHAFLRRLTHIRLILVWDLVFFCWHC